MARRFPIDPVLPCRDDFLPVPGGHNAVIALKLLTWLLTTLPGQLPKRSFGLTGAVGGVRDLIAEFRGLAWQIRVTLSTRCAAPHFDKGAA